MEVSVKVNGPLKEGRLVERVNRFLARVGVEGRITGAHVPNSGRMAELMVPGLRVFLTEHPDEARKTRFTLSLVDTGSALVSIDSSLPNLIFRELFRRKSLGLLRSYGRIEGEVTAGRSRLDYLLSNETADCYVEVKSVTLVRDGLALFPDAPTERGTKHLRELIRLRGEGHGAAVVFIVQRDDAESFSPNREADPDFAATMKEAKRDGINLLALTCRIDAESISIHRRIRVIL